MNGYLRNAESRTYLQLLQIVVNLSGPDYRPFGATQAARRKKMSVARTRDFLMEMIEDGAVRQLESWGEGGRAQYVATRRADTILLEGEPEHMQPEDVAANVQPILTARWSDVRVDELEAAQ
jgi:hypothetical protein